MAKKKTYAQKSTENSQALANKYLSPSYSTPAPSAPPPAPVYQAPDFRDSTYNDTINGAWRNLGDFTAQTAGAQQALRSRFGYSDDNFTIDPSNPFGQAQLLKRSYDQSKTGTQNSYASRGQQTSGAYNRQQGANLFNYQQGDDQLQKSFIDQKAQLLNALQNATNQYYGTAAEAAAAARDRGIAAGPVQSNLAAGPKPLGANERIAKSAQDGKQYVYRLKDGKWLRVREA